MRVFILEDDPSRVQRFNRALVGHHVEHFDNVANAVAGYNGPYDLVCLDHDLGGEVYVPSEHPNTGYAFSKWLADADADSPVIVHSMNQAGASRMVGRLGGRAQWVPFGDGLLNALNTKAGS